MSKVIPTSAFKEVFKILEKLKLNNIEAVTLLENVCLEILLDGLSCRSDLEIYLKSHAQMCLQAWNEKEGKT